MCNHRVSVFSKQLQFLNCLASQQLKHPVDVKVTPDSVVILDRSPNCIHFYSRSGDLLRSCVTQMASQWTVLCVVTIILLFGCRREYPHNRYLPRKDVKILSPSGHLIHEIGKVGHGRGEFVYPHGICVSRT